MATKPAAKADEKPRAAARLLDRAFGVASFKFNRWSVELDEHQTLEDALEPSFLANQVDKIMGHDKANPWGVGDVIELRKPDTGFYGELLILEIGTGFVHVDLIRQYEPKAVDIPENAPLTTKWNASTKKHDVIRKADKVVMKPGFQSKASAAKWIATHMKALAA